MKINFDDKIMEEIHEIQPKKIKPLGINLNYFAILMFGVFALFIIVGGTAAVEGIRYSFFQMDWNSLAENSRYFTSILIGSFVVFGYSMYTAFQNLFRLG